MAQVQGKKKKGEAAVPSFKDCANCGASEGTPLNPVSYRCDRCKNTYYCSVACQRIHWRKGGHKENCRTPEERVVMASQTLQGGAEDTGAADDGDAVGTIQGDDCAICLEPLGRNDKDDDVTTLSCRHKFHTACMSTMRRHGHGECPLCRKPLDAGAEKSFVDGMTALLRGNTSRAELLFREAIASDPDHSSALNNIASLLCQRGQTEEAIEFYRRNIAANPQHVESLTGLADICFRRRQLEECEALSRRALAVSSEDPVALLCMGRVLRDRGGDEQAALDYFRRAARANPEDHDNHFDLALMLLNHLPRCTKEEAAEAEASLKRACSIGADALRACAFFLLGVFLLCRRTADCAQQGTRLMESGVANMIKSDNHVEMFNMANHATLMACGSETSSVEDLRGVDARVLAQIEKLLKGAVKRDDDPDYRSNLIMILQAQEKWVEREKLKREFQVMDQTDVDARKKTTQACRAAEGGDKGRAELLLREAVGLNEYNPESLLNLAKVLIEAHGGRSMAKLAEAERLLRRSIAVDDKRAETHFHLGTVLNQQAMDESPSAEPHFLGRVNGADESFQRAVELDPTDVKSYMLKGFNLVMLRHDNVGAAKCFAAIVRLQPDHPTAQGHLDRCLRSMNPHQRTMYMRTEVELNKELATARANAEAEADAAMASLLNEQDDTVAGAAATTQKAKKKKKKKKK